MNGPVHGVAAKAASRPVAKAPCGEPLPVEELRRLPEALASRVLRGWLVAEGVPEPSYRHLLAVRSLVDDWHGQLGIDLPAGKRVVRSKDAAKLSRHRRLANGGCGRRHCCRQHGLPAGESGARGNG